MASVLTVGVVGERDPGRETHVATEEGLHHAAGVLGVAVDVRWMATEGLATSGGATVLEEADGLFVAPGSPYRSIEGALAAIRFARERDRPLLGTCGGFQHAVLEYARNVLGLGEAEHAEYVEGASCLVVTALECSLVGQTQTVHLVSGTRARELYGCDEAEEPYRCSFGLAPEYRSQLEQAGLRISGEDDEGEARIIELPEHRFFLATLYVPQLRSTPQSPHPLVCGFLRAAGS